MVPSQDFLKLLDFLSDKGDRSFLCSNEAIVCWRLDSFRMGVCLQEDQTWIGGLELLAQLPTSGEWGGRIWRWGYLPIANDLVIHAYVKKFHKTP